MSVIALCERGWVPDTVLRAGIRSLLKRRLKTERGDGMPSREQRLLELSDGPIAVATSAANEQHYEVPARFFCEVLGAHRKYSCAYWEDQTQTLDDAEATMLELTCQRAQLADGQDILELGCGWGALTVWMARRYPSSRITAVSNSSSQKSFIDSECRRLGLFNVTVITANMRDFSPTGQFDRVVSVEMFEHMRNYAELMRRISTWLRPGGYLFIHVFCHRDLLYAFETDGDADWMARNFFTGGIMPAADTLPQFQKHMTLENQWLVSGEHYFKTCEAWLERMDQNRITVRQILADCYGVADADLWMQRWRMFFMACGELFRFDGGGEWQVAHYCFRKPDLAAEIAA